MAKKYYNVTFTDKSGTYTDKRIHSEHAQTATAMKALYKKTYGAKIWNIKVKLAK